MDTSHVTWRKASYSAQNSQCVEVGVWRKATHSAQNSNCVEVASHPAPGPLCLVRDTKDRTGPHLAFSAPRWAAFVAAVKSGEAGPGPGQGSSSS
jgi:hypothetical protein